ncbi:hypothetical protein J7T55_006855 [Diaporthe amygdali]|uniref:uncharacterized protein n=1 Tax=Phomopsis amygdali TaxID=1214568 RepID=UPI0022FED715|nr:uncharacterized protein J7T55_006855 [Diaporthe amygdali]KAJ0125506.1 hypothetical protein J7T55_006855 [Diaporthe amygdali]
MSARNLTALGFSVGVGVITGVYIFKPTLEEQRKSNEFWRSPGEAQIGGAAENANSNPQDLTNQPPNRQGQGQGPEK